MHTENCLPATQELLQCLKNDKWSGLKVNSSNTQVVVFVIESDEPPLLNILKLKWCTEFKLLRINFDRMLDKMDCNYDKGFNKKSPINRCICI